MLIVQRLAHWVTPTDVQTELRERFGIDAAITTIMYYDPGTAGTELSQKWRAVFADARATYVRETSDIAISHRRIRITELFKLYKKDEARGATALAAQHLAQIAKEMGGAYTNKHVVVSGDPADELAKMLGVGKDQLLGALGGAGE